jgi:hypothetical protein
VANYRELLVAVLRKELLKMGAQRSPNIWHRRDVLATRGAEKRGQLHFAGGLISPEVKIISIEVSVIAQEVWNFSPVFLCIRSA